MTFENPPREILTLKNLALWRDETLLCESINLTIAHKEKVAVIGHNGSGKTTLLETIAGLCPIKRGEIRLFGETTIDVKQIGYLLQESDDHFLAPIAEDDIAFSILARGGDRKYAAEKTAEILSTLDIEHLAKKVVYHLSGGEKKLVALAGVLAADPKLLLLDEPTTALDYDAQLRVANILQKLDIGMAIVSHDREFLESIAHRFYALTPQTLKRIDDYEAFITHSHDGMPPHIHSRAK
ncbi:MAG: energy-coupling factor ABC transporter ATP-binding protein [Helicobacteraceae bacterium]|jgi:cobalt/nickel transport system ATP-binding protein|nr:energy-coupling factor ABC transporter ATP-binding protein [Helicobacteraceae bacterium]